MALSVTGDALDLALLHMEHQGDTDILPPAFEIAAIRHQWDELRPFLEAADLDTWDTGPHRRCLSPKQKLGLRVATQLDPLDTLLTTAIVIEAGESLEAIRLPVDERIVHSHRFERDMSHGRLYSSGSTFKTFRDHSLELAAANPGYVLITDVSDFYPRLYLHRVENALRSALLPDDSPGRVLIKFLSRWNQSVSYGLPVGGSAFRLVAEVTINDIDQAMRAEGYTFCRYSDDFRVFVESPRRAHEALAFLANALFKNHGLSLQEAKTEITTTDDFIERFSRSEQDAEADSLQEHFGALLQEVGIDTYHLPDFDELPEELLEEIERANLWQLQSDQLSAERPDSRTIRFALQQIGWWGLRDASGMVLDNIELLAALFPDALNAATADPSMTAAEMSATGDKLLGIAENTTFGHLEYFRAWILSIFYQGAAWNHSEKVQGIHKQYSDSLTRSTATLALGVCGVDHWFRSRRDELGLMEPWERRAFLAGAACLPRDERRHWYGSVNPGLTRLERAVVEWAKIAEQGARKPAPPAPVVPDEDLFSGWSAHSSDLPVADDDIPF